MQDLMDRNLLAGKSRSEVQGLLGPPDYCGVSNESDTVAVKPCGDLKEDWYGYKVITIARCHFWRCYMNVNFIRDSYRADSVAVSD